MRRLRALAVVVCALAGTAVAPAWACGCGGYLPDAASSGVSRARVNGENALVRFDGTTEQINLSMAVTGRSKSAAWIMPVPSAAKVELGRDGLFYQLEQATRPRTEYRTTHRPSWKFPRVFAGADKNMPAPGGGAEVREQMRLGPFQVARLGATSADAVTDWLREHGYVVPDGLAVTLRPYVEEHWEIVAVRLVPASTSAELSGPTPPLRLTFASQRIVYPMRMSRAATTPQTVTVYVAAPYKVRPDALPDPAVQPELLYAGRVEPSDGWLTEFAGPASYLTAYTATYREPGRIAADFRFGRAPSDEPFERVHVITENDPFWANVAITVAAHLLLLAGAVLLARRLHNRPARPPA